MELAHLVVTSKMLGRFPMYCCPGCTARVSRNFFSCFSCYACNLIWHFLGSWIYATIYSGCPTWPRPSLFWDLWLSWQSLLDFRTLQAAETWASSDRGAGLCRRQALSSGQSHLATGAVGTRCVLLQGHLWNGLGQSEGITVFSGCAEGLWGFEWMPGKRRMLWYL